VARTEVKSPVRGTVKRILVTTIGGVIQPGMNLVEIVPIDDSLLVDAKVLPKDIAFISPGQQAMVKFTAYDFSIHGGLIAHVTQISPDTIEDKEKNVWYYQVRLKTDSSVLGSAADPLPIIPGMTVQADILTGKKTVLDYLLKPILKTKELAFRER
jgi:adhesin transport system membrane fusion protein